jgi:plastocyanin
MLKKFSTVVVASILLGGCSLLPGSKPEPSSMPAASTLPAPVTSPAAEGAEVMMQQEGTQTVTTDGQTTTQTSSMQTITVKGNDFKYDVKEIKAKKGEQLKVVFMNTAGFHDFVIDELNVNSGKIAAGKSAELSIPTDKPGTYEFYCSVGNHRAQGMKGTLIIE